MIRLVIISILIFGLGVNSNAQSLTLDSCKAYALDNNKKLKAAQLNRDAAEQVKRNAFTNYFPKVDAGAMAMKSSKSFIEVDIPEMNMPVYDGNPATLANATQFTYFPGMSLELLDYANAGYIAAIQPIYAGGRIRYGNQLATLGKEFSQYQLKLSTEEVMVSTEYYYWTIIALEEKSRTLDNYKELMKSLIKDVTVSYEAGLIQKSDLLKVQLELNHINTNRLKLDNGISLLKMTLAQHIGIEYSENFRLVDTTIMTVAPEQYFISPKEALVSRNEYQMLNKAVDLEVLQKKMVRGEYMPTLAIGLQGLYLDILEEQNTYCMAFATVSVPISGWWGGSHKLKEHKIKINIAQNNLDEKSELLQLQMDKAYKDLHESYKQIMVSASSVEQTKEHLSVVKNNFSAGIVNTSDLLEAQAMHQQSQDALVDAKTTYKIRIAEYLKASGQIHHP